MPDVNSELIERVARALWELRNARNGLKPTDEDWEIDCEEKMPWVEQAFEQAHVALAALPEPSEEIGK